MIEEKYPIKKIKEVIDGAIANNKDRQANSILALAMLRFNELEED